MKHYDIKKMTISERAEMNFNSRCLRGDNHLLNAEAKRIYGYDKSLEEVKALFLVDEVKRLEELEEYWALQDKVKAYISKNADRHKFREKGSVHYYLGGVEYRVSSYEREKTMLEELAGEKFVDLVSVTKEELEDIIVKLGI